MARGFKQFNEYALQISNYEDIPKAVFAAIAVSALTCGGDRLEEANECIQKEWQTLYEAGIVPQKPKAA